MQAGSTINPVYTIQPAVPSVVQPVAQPVGPPVGFCLHDATGCIM